MDEIAGNARAELLAQLRQDAVLRGEFILSSGQKSDHYIDARRVTLSARGSAIIGLLLLDELEPLGIDAVAGPTLGGDPIVTAVAIMSQIQGVPIEALIVRKGEKEHGAGRRIEGPFQQGMRVMVLEDTVTTGASSLDAAKAIEEAGGIVKGIYALVDRQQGARENIEAAGYEFQALFDVGELL